MSAADPRRTRSRRKLIDAAVSLLAEGGVSAVTVEAITSLSGVARTTLYRNFSSSQSLVAAAFGELIPRASADTEGSAHYRMVDLLRRQYALVLTAPFQNSLLAWLAMGPADEECPGDDLGELRRGAVARYLEPINGVLDDAIAEGLLSEGERNLAIARIVGPAVITRIIGLPALTDDDLVRIVDDVFDSLRPGVTS